MRRDRRIKAKMNGPPHSRPKCLTLRSRSAFCEGKCSAFDVVKRQAPLGEGQAFSSSFGQAPLPFWPGPRALPGRVLANPHTVPVVFTFTLNDTLPPPLPHRGLDPRSPTLLVTTSRCRFAPDCRFASLRGTKQSRRTATKTFGVPTHGVRWYAMQAGMSSLRGHVRRHGIYACGLFFMFLSP